MKYCHECGTKLEDAEIYCHECGVKVAEEVPPAKSNYSAEKKSSYKVPLAVLLIVLFVGGAFFYGERKKNLSATATVQNDAYYVDVADRQKNNGDYRAAISNYQRALELNSQNKFANFGLGYCYNALGEYQNAMKFYKKCIALDAYDDAAYGNLGNVYFNTGDYSTAISHYLKAVELNPKNDIVHYNLGNTYLDLEDYEGAIFMYNKVVELNPQKSQAYYNMGIAYERMGNYDKELQYLNKAIELEPNNEFYRTTRENVLNYFFYAKEDARVVLESYYNFIASANPRAAFNLLSYDMQSYMNGVENFAKNHANVSLNRVSNVNVVSSGENIVILEYRLDSNSWEHGREISRAFSGTATLEKIGGNWIISDLKVKAL